MLRGYVLALAIVAFWFTGSPRAPGSCATDCRAAIAQVGPVSEIDPNFFRLEGGLESRFLRGAAVVLLLALAVRFYLGRYEMVYNEHGSFLVGVDYVDQNFGLPLQWLLIFRLRWRPPYWSGWAAGAGGLAWRWRWWSHSSLPRAVAGALRARPTKSRSSALTSRRTSTPRAALSAWSSASSEMEFQAQPDAPIDVAQNQATLDNVRLWDRRAFHDTISQIQALRPYYVFHDIDVDRYTIDGQLPPGAAGAARVGYQPASRDARQLDQPGIHLHPRLRHGAGGRQPDHPRRPTGAADRRRSAAWSTRPA